MDNYFSLGIVGRDGMYTCGERTATPELALQARGNLQRREGDRLGVYCVTYLPGYWTDSSGNQHRRTDKPVLVQVEATPGEWG
jgi:hypothetical protein